VESVITTNLARLETNPERNLAMDETKLTEFVEKAVGDVGALLGGAMVVIGDKLGLYRAMAGAGPLTPAELAVGQGQPSGTYGNGQAPKRPAAT
jgi:hypothetical protein